MNILITGGTGFLGNNIQKKWLDCFPHCNCYVMSSRNDLRNFQNCERMLHSYKPDVVIHAAGSVGGIGANKENPGKFMYDNLAMGLNMIEATRQYGDIRFIMLGTVCSYPKFAEVPFQEKELWDGRPEETNAPYGIAKKTLMELVINYHKQYGFRGVNLIPVNMYGPYDNFDLETSHVIPALISKFVNAVNNGERDVTLWGTGNASREFLFVEDCVEAISLAVKSDVGPEPINIGTGNEITIKELARVIASMVGYNGDIWFDSSKPDGQPRRCLDTSVAKEKLGFVASTDLYKGLKKTLKWYLENKKWN